MSDADFLAAGSYGCVYKPPGLPCPDHPEIDDRYKNVTTVTKLLRANEAEQELMVASYLKQIDPTQAYFVYALESSLCVPSKVQIEHCATKAPILYMGPIEPEQYIMYRMARGDMSLDHVVQNAGKNVDEWKKVMQYFVDTWRALAALHYYGIYHLDLGPTMGNIIISTFTDGSTRGRIIDFGLSIVLKEVLKDDKSKSGLLQRLIDLRAPFWPPELLQIYVQLKHFEVNSDPVKMKDINDEFVKWRTIPNNKAFTDMYFKYDPNTTYKALDTNFFDYKVFYKQIGDVLAAADVYMLAMCQLLALEQMGTEIQTIPDKFESIYQFLQQYVFRVNWRDRMMAYDVFMNLNSARFTP